MTLPNIDALDVDVEITEEEWDINLGCLPPIFCTVGGKPGFAISEPHNHIWVDGKMVPTFHVFYRDGVKYWEKYKPCYLRRGKELCQDEYEHQWSRGWEAV